MYQNTVKQKASTPEYEDEHFRATHGYKELNCPDPAARRNRDFKPVPYGTYGGLPNYRHAEPFMQIKNFKDIIHEQDHLVIKYIKTGLFGAATGVVFG